MLQAVSRGAAASKQETKNADVAELADALDSGSSESDFIWVRVPSSAPKKNAEKIQLFVPILRFLLLFRAILPF